MGFKSGQVSIFIIIAIVIIALVFGYLFLRGTISTKGTPPSIQPAYTSFLTCLEEYTNTGIGVLESQGGYIKLPAFDPGSDYMPFSSQLNFVGTPIPYWYYVSKNNIQKEQIPSKSDMEKQLGDFIASKIRDCNLRNYYGQGFIITMENPSASVSIKDSSVDVKLNMQLTIQKGNDTSVITTHQISDQSPLGQLYNDAKKVYDIEQQNMFLENYTIDELRLYAPVDGVEITCGPLTWNANTVFDTLQNAIEANTQALRSPGSSNNYFSVKLPVNEQVRFLNSKNWPNSFEVAPTGGQILSAYPVGNQPGLGAVGFCYVPYHFVYNIKYPVLIQLYQGQDIFQFPFAVVVQGNNPRQSLNVTASPEAVPNLCLYNNTAIQVNTYDINKKPVDANISYECLGNVCDMGSVNSGTLSTNFPQCANGYVIAKAQGFKDTRYLFSTVQQGSLDIIMDRIYQRNVQLLLDGKPYNGNAIITFDSNYATQTIYYPDQKTINLGEGQQNIQAQILVNSSIKVGATTKQQCITVPKGILGIIGITKQQCFEIKVPEQVISNAIIAGGNTSIYFTEDQVAKGTTLQINAQSFPAPNSLDQVQKNYALLDQSQLDIQIK